MKKKKLSPDDRISDKLQQLLYIRKELKNKLNEINEEIKLLKSESVGFDNESELLFKTIITGFNDIGTATAFGFCRNMLFDLEERGKETIETSKK